MFSHSVSLSLFKKNKNEKTLPPVEAQEEVPVQACTDPAEAVSTVPEHWDERRDNK